MVKTERARAGIKKILAIVLAAILCLAVSAVVVYAVVLFSFRVDGTVKGDADDISGNVIDLSVNETPVTFKTAGEKISVPLTVKNSSDANVSYYFDLSADNSSSGLSDEKFKEISSAILVYFDGEFKGTLLSVCEAVRLSDDGFVMAKGESAREITHNLELELHIASTEDALGKTFGLRVTAFVCNADYRTIYFVSDEAEFLRAAEDINGGISAFDETDERRNEKPTIILANDVAINSGAELKKAANLNLCGYGITFNADLSLTGEGEYKIYSGRPVASFASGSGSIIVNNGKAVLNIEDFSGTGINADVNAGAGYADKVELLSYDGVSAATHIAARAEKTLKNGILHGASKNVLGALNFYSEEISGGKISLLTSGECSYLNGTITASDVFATSLAGLSVGKEKIEFKIIGADDEIFASVLENELAHIPNNPKGDAVVADVFLPKRIEGKNVSIEWRSSDESSITPDGKLADTLKENTIVTLYAKIIVNDKVYTSFYTFKVTSQTRETKFKYLVAQLSPVVLTNVLKEGENEAIAKFHLPVASGNYDYRKSFDMIMSSENESVAEREWEGFKDIGIESITYAVKSGYNFVSLDSSYAVYLNTATFYTFAQLSVTAKFSDGEECEESVNVIIKLGSNSELYELAFSYVEKKFGEVDILQNIIDTRSVYGMKYECGDFYLENVYQSINISYEPAATGGGITEIVDEGDKFLVKVNPEKFSLAKSSLGIKVSVKKEGDDYGQSRILYVDAPAVIKPDENGFANYSVFNSVKYQTALAMTDSADESDVGLAERIAALPPVTVTDGDKGSNGFTVTGNVLTNSTPDYILVRDAEKVTSLEFRTGNGSGASAAHYAAYRFALLLAWATGNKTTALPFSFGSYATSGTARVMSDGKEYMNETEAAVLKDFLTLEAGFSSAEAEELWNSATETPTDTTTGKPLHIIDNYEEITQIAAQNAASVSDKLTYFKYTELLQWALNEKDFPNSGFAGNTNPLVAPNLGVTTRYSVDMSGSATTNVSSTSLDWNSNPQNWVARSTSTGLSQKYAGYSEDQTEYISDQEAQIIMAYWWGATGSDTRAKNYATAFLKACIVPTYLHEDGAGKMVNAIYEKLRGDDFSVRLSGDLPEISVMDFSANGLAYFTGLTDAEIYGETNEGTDEVVLSAFITAGSVNNYFNRITAADAERENAQIKNLVMQACANGYATLDLKNADRLSAVRYLDLSYNEGIKTVGDVLNTDIKKITYLDVHKVGVSGEFLTYVLDNIALNSSAEIYYTDEKTNGRTSFSATVKSVSDELRFLNELTEVNSPYLVLAKTANAGKGDKTIQWYLESGNPAYLISAAGSDKITADISSADEMNRLLTNYFYCTRDISCTLSGVNYNLVAGKLYKIRYRTTSGAFSFTEVTGEIVNDSVSADGKWQTGETLENSYTSEELSSSLGGEVTRYTNLTSSSITRLSGVTVETAVNKNTGNPYVDFVNSSGISIAWIRVKNLYIVTQVIPYTATYRRYLNQVKISRGNKYYSDGSVYSVDLTMTREKTKYIDYTVTENRYYRQYFIERDSTSATYLEQIFSGQITCESNSRVNPVNMDDYTKIWYGSKDTEFEYRTSSGDFVYTVEQGSTSAPTPTVATVGGVTFSGANAKEQAENYIDGLDPENEFFSEGTAASEIAYSWGTPSVLYNYVTALANADNVQSVITSAGATMNGYVLYKYTGTTGSANVYENGSATSKNYTRNQGYLLKFGTTGTTSGYYYESKTIVTAGATAVTMENVLAEASLHKSDGLFGNYYGNYYCYNGTTVTVNGFTFERYGVYRLLLDSNGEFYFEHDNLPEEKRTFKYISTNDDFMDELTNALSGADGALPEGKLVYFTGNSDSYYGNGFFELTYNRETMTYYFKSAGAFGNVTMDSSGQYAVSDVISGQNLSLSGISKLTNMRYVGSETDHYYSGTGGSEEAIIVARITETDENGEKVVHERRFKVTVSI